MKRLLARLELIEATGVLDIHVGWVNGNYQRILLHSVRTASADRIRRMAAPRRHLALDEYAVRNARLCAAYQTGSGNMKRDPVAT